MIYSNSSTCSNQPNGARQKMKNVYLAFNSQTYKLGSPPSRCHGNRVYNSKSPLAIIVQHFYSTFPTMVSPAGSEIMKWGPGSWFDYRLHPPPRKKLGEIYILYIYIYIHSLQNSLTSERPTRERWEHCDHFILRSLSRKSKEKMDTPIPDIIEDVSQVLSGRTWWKSMLCRLKLG